MASTLYFSIASLCQQAQRDGHKHLQSIGDWDKLLGSNYSNLPVTVLGEVYAPDQVMKDLAVPLPNLFPATPPLLLPQ